MGHYAIGFGDDPEIDAISRVVGREDPCAVLDGLVVPQPIFLVEIAAVATRMTAESVQEFERQDRFSYARCHQQLP
jgi:hypothetical protein